MMTSMSRSYPVTLDNTETTTARDGVCATSQRPPFSATPWIAALVIGLLAVPTWAGVEIHSTTTDHSADPARHDSGSTLVSEGSLRTELEVQQGDRKRVNTTIYRGAFKDFLVLDHQDKTFTLLDKDSIEELKSQLEHSMLQLDRQLAEMPPEQRKLFQSSLQASAAKSTRVIATDDVAEKSGFSCRRFEVRAGDELVRETWVASWDQIPEGDTVRNAMEGMESFFVDLNEAFESVTSAALGGAKVFDLGDNPVEDLSRFGGLPIITRNFKEGQLVTETVIKTVTPRSLNQGDFVPPSNYKRRSASGQ